MISIDEGVDYIMYGVVSLGADILFYRLKCSVFALLDLLGVSCYLAVVVLCFSAFCERFQLVANKLTRGGTSIRRSIRISNLN